MEHDAVVQWLSSPDAYDPRPDVVDVIQTHISFVFLAGDFVYKLKKPVHYDFLDFSTIEAREHACREEIRLNRRLAPGIYLGVLPITRDASGTFQLKGSGPAVDWVVHMRRLPADQTLDALVKHGVVTPLHADRLAETLVNFYRGLAPLEISPGEYRTRYRGRVEGNFRELGQLEHHLPLVVVRRVHGYQRQFLALRPDEFDARVGAGRIIEGHGDLRPEHICFTPLIAIFDCIEFNAAFRQIDPADELAFLATECDALGAEWIGPRVLARFELLSEDRVSPELFDFYKSYRSCVRAKVDALRADQVEGAEKERLIADAISRLNLADRYVAPWLRPLVLVVGGMSGTGKTTLAQRLATLLGAEHLRTDVVRQEMFTPGSTEESVNAGKYEPQARELVYTEMARRAGLHHAQRLSVILDGTFASAESVQLARSLANDPRSLFLAVECRCRPETAIKRIEHRLSQGTDASEARPEVYTAQRANWRPWPGDVPRCMVDTERPLDVQAEAVLAALGQRLAG